jgi:hypothetical protein
MSISEARLTYSSAGAESGCTIEDAAYANNPSKGAKGPFKNIEQSYSPQIVTFLIRGVVELIL